MDNRADDDDKRGRTCSEKHERINGRHGVEGDYSRLVLSRRTEHGEQEKRAVHNIGQSVHFLVIARIVSQSVYELHGDGSK